MTDPSRSFYTNFGRFYAHPKFQLERFQAGTAIGREVSAVNLDDPYAPKPSITNIIGMLDKKFLPPYYAKLVAEYAVENYASVGETIRKFGPKVAVGSLKAIPNLPNPASAVGDEVHDAIDLWMKHSEPGVPFVYEFSTSTASAMFAQFLNFIDIRHPRVVRSEFTVWSYKHGYAGTGDLIWYDEDALTIVDTKTGNHVHPEVGMQTAAAMHADVILDPDGTEQPMPAIKKLQVMHVRPRSVKLYELYRAEECFKAFLGLKAAFDWARYDREHVIAQEPFKTEIIKEAA